MHHGTRGALRQGAAKKPLSGQKPDEANVNDPGVFMRGVSRIIGASMRSCSFLTACLVLVVATAAQAETHLFIVANTGDGYGVDQCLVKGEKCGAHAALSYCRSRDFARATSYRRAEPGEIAGALPARNCQRGRCNWYVAITCER